MSVSSPITEPGTACKRCRLKKLKCDSLPQKCRNCARSDMPCLVIDSVTKREYERSHVDTLRRDIKYYEDALRQREQNHGSGTSLEINLPESQPNLIAPSGQSRSIGAPDIPGYHGAGSIVTLAQLVAAAVAAKTRTTSFIDFGNEMGQEQSQLDRSHAKEAAHPVPAVAQALLDTYLNGPHVLHPFLQRSEIMQTFHSLSTGPRLAGKFLFRFYMVCAVGALYLNRTGLHDTPAIDYYMAAMPFEEEALKVEGLELAQNILLLMIFSGQYEIGIGNKWEITRLAVRICVENGFHRNPPSDIPLLEQQIRKRIFWVAYGNERHASSMLGRPFAIQDSDITTQLPIDADDDLIEADQTHLQPERGVSEVTVQLRHIKIRQTTSRIHAASVRPRIGGDGAKSEFHAVLNDLNEWRSAIITVENTTCPYHSRQWVDLNFFKEALSCYKAIIIPSPGQSLHHQHGTVDDVLGCAESAIQIPRCYETLPSSEWRVMNWTCVQDLLSAGFAILYSLHAMHEICSSSGTVIGDSLLQQAFSSLEICSTLLSHIAQQWKSVHSNLGFFEILTRATRRIVSSQGRSEPLVGMDLPQFDFHMDGIDFDQLDWEQILSVPVDPILGNIPTT